MVGQIVWHSRFGKGVIREYEHPYLKILFEDNSIEKRFAYPMVFGSYLRFEDPALQAEAEAAVAGIRAADSKRAEEQALEFRRRENALLEAHKEEMKAKRAAAAKKAASTRAAKRKTDKQA